MGSKGLYKSAASVRLSSGLKCKRISPKDATTIGIVMTRAEWEALKVRGDMLFSDPEVDGELIVTGYPKTKRLTILGRRKKRKQNVKANR